MSTPLTVNGYLIKEKTSDAWWIIDSSGDEIAGPFASQQQAAEVAGVLQDQPAPLGRKNKR